MGAADGPGPVEYEDPVGAGRGGDPVGHDDEGAGAVRERPLGAFLGQRVQVQVASSSSSSGAGER